MEGNKCSGTPHKVYLEIIIILFKIFEIFRVDFESMYLCNLDAPSYKHLMD